MPLPRLTTARPWLACLLALAATPAACADSDTATVYQQRSADGRVVLTDRPQPNARTERTWLTPREDPALARQRALEVQLEASEVSRRVQRAIELQQERLAAAERERSRLAAAEAERVAAAEREDRLESAVVFYPWLVPAPSLRPPHRHRPWHRAHAQPRREPGSLRGSAAPENR